MRVLDTKDLDKGNVSMEIVSTRMGRHFSKAEKIRMVIQSIFHMSTTVTMWSPSAGFNRTAPLKAELAGESSWPSYSTESQERQASRFENHPAYRR